MERQMSLAVLLLLIVHIGGRCDSYVLNSVSTTEDFGDDQNTETIDKQSSEIDLASTTPSAGNEHITKIIHPSEIREPTLPELTTFVKELDAKSPQAPAQQPARTKPKAIKVITYSELNKLLGNWKLSNEKNYYEMPTAKGSKAAIKEMPENFVSTYKP